MAQLNLRSSLDVSLPCYWEGGITLLSKREFDKVFNLAIEQKWLSGKLDALKSLLFEDCLNSEHMDLVIELLGRFRYVYPDDLASRINDLVLEIITTPEINPDNTIIAAMAADSSPDSSQYLVQLIKPKLSEYGWGGVEIVNTFAAAYRKSKSDGFFRKKVVLIDEFVGSGKTVISRCDEIKRQFGSATVDVDIAVRVLFASSVGKNFLLDQGVNFNSIEEINKGITDFYSDEDAKRRIRNMLEIESKLSAEAGDHKMVECTLGYGKTECLFGIDGHNTPNSVFPIFWWPTKVDGMRRQTILTRWVGG
ncbi:phosphoribosyltransferase-like protein [Chromobacterium violaceum]|uniref:phosphoribosyltransferase-like protein n=1 Tax=Chromobacterium violaceum TaxID=536 RepID=UPI00111C7880|nr:hypothetical protein [Chromobacterium violaceum]